MCKIKKGKNMIVVRSWGRFNRRTFKTIKYKGVFLFGLIPIFISIKNIE